MAEDEGVKWFGKVLLFRTLPESRKIRCAGAGGLVVDVESR